MLPSTEQRFWRRSKKKICAMRLKGMKQIDELERLYNRADDQVVEAREYGEKLMRPLNEASKARSKTSEEKRLYAQYEAAGRRKKRALQDRAFYCGAKKEMERNLLENLKKLQTLQKSFGVAYKR